MKRAISSYLAMSLLVLAACGDDDDSTPGGSDGVDSIAFAVGTDFVGASVASRVLLPEIVVEANTLAGVASTDPVVKYTGDLIFVINRFNFDNVTIIDPITNTLVEQRSTGAGSNPQDVVVVGDTAYVATMGGSGLVALDLTAPGAAATPIDLSSLDAEDGIPNCHAVEAVGIEIFVSCQYRDDGDDFLSARGPGKVAVVSIGDQSLSNTIVLTGTPSGRLQSTTGSNLLVPIVDPTFADLTVGCVESIDTAEGESAGCLIDHDTLGGYVTNLAPQANGGYLATVVDSFDAEDFGANGSLWFFDDDAEPMRRSDAEQRIFSMTTCPTGEVIVAQVNTGLRVYMADGAELTTGALDIGAPPVQDGVVCFEAN